MAIHKKKNITSDGYDYDYHGNLCGAKTAGYDNYKNVLLKKITVYLDAYIPVKNTISLPIIIWKLYTQIKHNNNTMSYDNNNNNNSIKE